MTEIWECTYEQTGFDNGVVHSPTFETKTCYTSCCEHDCCPDVSLDTKTKILLGTLLPLGMILACCIPITIRICIFRVQKKREDAAIKERMARAARHLNQLIKTHGAKAAFRMALNPNHAGYNQPDYQPSTMPTNLGQTPAPENSGQPPDVVQPTIAQLVTAEPDVELTVQNTPESSSEEYDPPPAYEGQIPHCTIREDK